MAQKDIALIIGICKSKENNLIGQDKFNRMIECDDPLEAVKILKESGFGGDIIVENVLDYDKLVEYQEKDLIKFIKEYSPNDSFKAYALLANDYHNAECIVRNKFLKVKIDMLLEDGMYLAEDIEQAIEQNKLTSLPIEMQTAITKAIDLFENDKATGLNISTIFSKAKYESLVRVCKVKPLNSFISYKINCLNIAIALRCRDYNAFCDMQLSGGTILQNDYKILTTNSLENIMSKLSINSPKQLISTAISCLTSKKPFVQFENMADSYFLKTLKTTMYEINGIEPLLLYYHYRLNEITNVKIVMSGIINGEDASSIKSRMRENYAG